MKQILFLFLVFLLCLTEITTKKSKKKSKKNPSVKVPPYPVYKEKSNGKAEGRIGIWINLRLEKDLISYILGDVQSATCLSFEKRLKPIKKRIGINFYFRNGKSEVKLSKSEKEPTIVYLNKSISSDRKQLTFYVGRALGLIPEVLREDRDKFVKILWGNIDKKYKDYYKKKKSFKTETGFDFSSAMINDFFYGSKNDSVMAYESYFFPFYEKQYDWYSNFSYNDNRRLNDLYCNMRCSKVLPCRNGGYYSKTCDKCECPPGFKGKLCSEITKNPKNCPYKNVYYKTRGKQKKVVVFKKIKGTCKYFIKSKRDKKVRVEVMSLDYKEGYVCKPGSNVEIRYQKDKGTKGLVLCTNVTSYKLPALSKKVLIYFNDLNGKNQLKLRYYDAKKN